MTALLSIILGLLVLGILVFIHELGHFLAAKACGIRVLAFSLGFGNPLFRKTVNGTEYRISAIPFGGYVKMAGENPEEDHTGSPDEFQSKPVWQRMTVAIAGPLFNYVSAFFMLVVMFVVGVERPVFMERSVIGAVSDASAAMKAGLVAGDSIVSINGKTVENWEEVEQAFALQEPLYTINVSRNGQIISSELTLKKNPKGSVISDEPTGGLQPCLPPVIGGVKPGSAAEDAGLQAGDRMVSINGKKVNLWYDLPGAVKSNGDSIPLLLVVDRNGKERTFKVQPRFNKEANRYLIGVGGGVGDVRVIRYGVGEAVARGVGKTWENTVMIFDVLGKLFSKKVSANQLSGPLGIIPASGFIALQGFSKILGFMALIGINLAVLNLMPLIITDGGLIFFMIIEVIRGKPLSLKTQALFNKIAMAFFLTLFLYVSFNDVKRLGDIFKIMGK